ncbi:alpha/beta hydrolase [Paenibacillus psychroresistens]|uniref:Alpha/beta hydrolase n=1 Tax=Paenibacillus psychroresistens TaxID=1778678 RepID=A0A6B8RGF4_9BACL|nr:alpha/beta hydrolase [Paenibacillus psychroresistens]QGQ94665.1 alpha/beta hydrolase [Paenibacillus psychroresistens]
MGLYVEESGQKNKTTIVFLHGEGTSSWMWRAQIDQLTNYHILVLDLPEHRGSMVEGAFSIANSAEKVAEIIRKKAHGGRAHVVGFSLGGQVAIQLLSIASELVESAVVSGVLVKSNLDNKIRLSLLELYVLFKHYNFLIRAKFRRYGIPEKYYEEFKKDSLLTTPKSLERILTENFNYRVPANASNIQSRLLLLVGEKEPDIMFMSNLDLYKAIPEAQGFVVSEMNHFWPLQEPALFTKSLRAWIENKDLPKELIKMPY